MKVKSNPVLDYFKTTMKCLSVALPLAGALWLGIPALTVEEIISLVLVEVSAAFLVLWISKR